MFFSDDWTDFSKFLTSIFSFGSIETTFKKGRWGSRCIIYLFAESEFHLGVETAELLQTGEGCVHNHLLRATHLPSICIYFMYKYM